MNIKLYTNQSTRSYVIQVVIHKTDMFMLHVARETALLHIFVTVSTHLLTKWIQYLIRISTNSERISSI